MLEAAGHGVSAGAGESPAADQAAKRALERRDPSSGSARSAKPGSEPDDAPGIVSTVTRYVQENPIIAATAAFTVGAAIVMAMRTPARSPRTLDRRAAKAVRSIEDSFNREMRALRSVDVSSRLDQLGSAVGGALGKVDLAAIGEQAKDLIAVARKRIGG